MERKEITGGLLVRRIYYLVLMLTLIGLGLLSRRLTFFPFWLGDSLWAMTVYAGFDLVWPQVTEKRKASLALFVAFLVEYSQLLQWPWLQKLRQTVLGHLLLGQGFLWSDLLAYTLGIAVMYWLMTKKETRC